jgi:hypothetical protein
LGSWFAIAAGRHGTGPAGFPASQQIISLYCLFYLAGIFLAAPFSIGFAVGGLVFWAVTTIKKLTGQK